MRPSDYYHKLFEQLNDNTLILTVNQRLSGHIQQALNDWHQRQGDRVFKGNQVLAWSAWLNQLWQSYQCHAEHPKQLLSPVQISWQWQQIISNSDKAAGLLNVQQAAALAQTAWEQCVQWCHTIHSIPTPYSDEVASFIDWATSFEHYCEQNHAICQVACPAILIDYLQAASALPAEILLLGFDSMTPLQEQFHAALQSQGVQVVHWAVPHETTSPTLYATANAQQQCQAISNWISRQPGHYQLGIVVPNLQTQRDAIERSLKSTQRPYSISGGLALSQYPIIADAITCLHITGCVERDTWQQWLQSPFLVAAETEQLLRAQLAKALPEYFASTVPAHTMLEYLQQQSQCPIVAQGLVDFLAIKTHAAMPEEWYARFLKQLDAIGWPGERSLDSTEYQAVEKFNECLRQLPLVLGSAQVNHAVALKALNHIVRQTMFQPKSHEQATVHVMGQLEATGLVFDAIWLCNMNAQQIPASPSPSPFLPVHWQRQLNMPHATAEREHSFAAQWWAQLQTQATQLIVSYVAWEGDIPLNKSGLLAGIPETALVTDPVRSQRAEFEVVEDRYGLPLTAAELVGLKGGAGIFKSQSLCPFQAYGRYRLGLQPEQAVPEYWDPALRGIVLHEILEQAWSTLKSQQGLLSYASSALESLIAPIVNRVCHRWQQRYPHCLPAALFEIERDRLQALVCAWLEIEKQRAPFKIEAEEKNLFKYINDIPVHLRPDRLDRLADGSLMVIDYKTSRVHYRAWLGERMEEPQLPLYAVLTQADAVAFAVLRPEQKSFSGLSARAADIEGVFSVDEAREVAADNWQLQMQSWEAQFDRLAQEFKQGYAAVDPIDVNKSCGYCGLQRVCRVYDC